MIHMIISNMFWYSVDPGFIVIFNSHKFSVLYKIQSIFPQAIN